MANRPLEYDEVEISLEPGPDGYFVRASSSGAEVRAPFDKTALERFDVEQLVASALNPRHHSVSHAALAQVTGFGTVLFEALIRGDVRDLYRGASAKADARGRGLRILLQVTNAEEMRQLPWELLYDDPSFLVLDRTTPVVRGLDLPLFHDPVTVEPPLRILGVVSSPQGVPPLQVDQERRNVEQALGKLLVDRVVALHWLERATLPELLRTLRADSFHVLHFIGHGGFDEHEGDGVLLMQDDVGRPNRVSGRRLGQILRGHDSLRLAVLNACESGRDSVQDPYAGVAGSLLRQGVPAVVAMQFEITDVAAIAFSRDFYDALAQGYPVDAAVAEARRAVWADHNDFEWATPALFARAANGVLFDVRPHAQDDHSEPQQRPEPPPSRFRPRVSRRTAVAALTVAIALLAAVLLWRGRGSSPSEVTGWSRLPDLPVALEAAGMATFDGRVWVAGGVAAAEGRPKLTRVDVYDPGTRTWRAGPALPVPMDHGSLVATAETLYFLGGISTTGSVSTVYRLDSPTGPWREDAPLPQARGAGAAAWDGSRLVFAGGVASDGRAANDVWALQAGAWSKLGSLQRPREKLAAASDGYGTVWFMAGRDPNDQANAFPYVDVAQAAAVKPAGQIAAVQGPAGVWWPNSGPCILGGQDARGFSGGVDCLGQRPPMPELSPGRAGLGAAVSGGTLYVAGGYSAGVHGATTFEALTLAP